MTKATALLPVLFLMLLGCASEPVYGTEDPFEIGVRCTLDCGPAYDECVAENDRWCADCYRTTTICGDICSDAHCDFYCDPDEDPCREAEGTATLGERDPEVFAACMTYAERNTACGEQAPTTAECELFSATEKRRAKGTYECLASTPCGGDLARCQLGTDAGESAVVCGAIRECAPELEGSCETDLAPWMGWLRHDVLAASHDCAAQDDCVARLACYDAWFSALGAE